jgi:hypothetical protein
LTFWHPQVRHRPAPPSASRRRRAGCRRACASGDLAYRPHRAGVLAALGDVSARVVQGFRWPLGRGIAPPAPHLRHVATLPATKPPNDVGQPITFG